MIGSTLGLEVGKESSQFAFSGPSLLFLPHLFRSFPLPPFPEVTSKQHGQEGLAEKLTFE